MGKTPRKWFHPRARTHQVKQAKRRRRRLQIELMESRRLLAVDVSLSGNDLEIVDLTSAQNALTISTDTINSRYEITDSNNLITTSILGATGSGTNTVLVPFSSVTGSQVVVATGDGNDTVTFDGNFDPGSGFTVNVDGEGGSDTVNWASSHSIDTLNVTSESISIQSSVTTSGDQSWSGSVTTTGDVILAGTAVSLPGTVNSGANAFTINATGLVSLGSAISSTVGNLSLSTTGNLDVSPSASVASTSGNVTLQANTLTMASGSSLSTGGSMVLNVAQSSTVSAVIGGSGSLTKSGNGTLTLSGANTYAGSTSILAGAVKVQSATALGTTAAGTIVASGAALQFQGGVSVGAEPVTISGSGPSGNGALEGVAGFNSFAGAVTLADDATITSTSGVLDLSGSIVTFGHVLTFDGDTPNNPVMTATISGAGSVVKQGTAQLTLWASNSYTGATSVLSGSLMARTATALGTTDQGTTVADGATLTFNGNFTSAEDVSIAGIGNGVGGAMLLSNGLNLTGNIHLTGSARISIQNSSSSATISGPISDGGNAYGVEFQTWDSTRTITLSGSNTYGGSTLVFGGGTLEVTSANAIPSTSAVTVSGGTTTLSLQSANLEIGSLSGNGNVALGTSSITIGSDDSSTTFSGAISGSGGLTKTGAGTLSLGGINTFTGVTQINSGYLGGSGTLAGTMVVASGAGLAPGNSPGVLNTANLDLQAGSTLEIEIGGQGANPGIDYDQVNVTGTVSLAGNLEIIGYGDFLSGEAFVIINNDGADTVSGTFAGLAEGSTVRLGASDLFTISYLGGDGNDVVLTSLNDTRVVTNTNDTGSGSLRDAINNANAFAGPELVVFAIPGDGPHTIAPATALPFITDTLALDAYTQPGASQNTLAVGSDAVLKIIVDGNQLNNFSGFVFWTAGASGSSIRGFDVSRFSYTAQSDGIAVLSTSGVTIAGNYIGTDVTGSTSYFVSSPDRMYNGIRLTDASGTTIGGESPADRNLISGNITGIRIDGAGSFNNTIVGNYIGTDASGTTRLINSNGIEIRGFPSNNTIGGVSAGARNVISGNSKGVSIEGVGTGNAILGNYIGPGADGIAVSGLGNTTGVQVRSSQTVVGGSSPGEGNVISGNSNHGILLWGTIGNVISGITVQGNLIGPHADESGALSGQHAQGGINLQYADALIGTNADGSNDGDEGNVISGNTQGILFNSGSTATVAGNLIGLTSDGSTALGNTDTGIYFNGASNTTIGGTTSLERNVISASIVGIRFSQSTSTGNKVQGNYIGTDATGTLDRGNSTGVLIYSSAAGNLVGTDGDGVDDGLEGNVISGNNRGVEIQTGNNTVAGNIIGLAADGGTDLGNSAYGVYLNGANASTNTIGGDLLSERNIISGNDGDGVYLQNSGASNTIIGNFIGLATDGETARGNGSSSSYYGIHLSNSGNATISGNVISGNRNGLRLVSAGSANNSITGNFIGTNATGNAAIGNLGHGIIIETAAGNNTIGGTTAAERNVIAGHDSYGVWIKSTAGTGNTVIGNYVGTNAAGTAALANQVGVIADASGTIVGGSASGAGNLISGNTFYGVQVSTAAATDVVIQGNLIGTNADGNAALGNRSRGIIVTAGNVLIGSDGDGTNDASEGNVISGNIGKGVELRSGNTTLAGNIIGLGADGLTRVANTQSGVYLWNVVTGTQIGGDSVAKRNVISGNTTYGIEIFGSGVTDTVIQGNYIGTDVTGQIDVGNIQYGIAFLQGTYGNLVGGDDDDDGSLDGQTLVGNVISGNNSGGIYSLGSNSNVIQGNVIGLKAGGSSALGNDTGIVIGTDSDNNLIGGINAGAANIISGNNQSGISIRMSSSTANQVVGNLIGLDITGAVDVGNGGFGIIIDGSSDNTIGGSTSQARNVISGNSGAGVLIGGTTATGNVVSGNYIGTDASGLNAIPNAIGVSFDYYATNNLIGGDAAGEGNVISGNLGAGVVLGSELGNTVTGNFIGVDATGTAALGNASHGILVDHSPGNTIGGTTAGQRNIISGNSGSGISIEFAESTGNTIVGNYIGTDVTGALDVGNTQSGIYMVFAGASNVIGGTAAGAENVISGNNQHGIWLNATHGVSMLGNIIGANAAGTASLGNGSTGILLSGSGNNSIGSGQFGAGNLISGNGQYGVAIHQATATGNAIQGNLIGLNAAGNSAIGNTNSGVYVYGDATNNLIGTDGDGIDDAGEGNTIAGNGFQGIKLSSGSNTVAGNRINMSLAGDALIAGGGSIVIDGGADHRIGTDGDGTSDDLEGNALLGYTQVSGAVTGVTYAGNTFGFDISGSTPLSTTNVTLGGGGDHTFGGNIPAERNVVAGGLRLTSDSNTVVGNYIGIDASGTNGVSGTDLQIEAGASNNQIGSTNPSEANVIRRIRITGAGTSGNIVEGNRIGIRADGSDGLGGLIEAAVYIDNGASSNIIGTPEAGNVIATAQGGVASSFEYGVYVLGAGTDQNVIQNNRIGTNPLGTAVIGHKIGVFVDDGAAGTTVGGLGPNEGNTIAGGSIAGVKFEQITDADLIGNTIIDNVEGVWAVESSPWIANNRISNNSSNGINLFGNAGGIDHSAVVWYRGDGGIDSVGDNDGVFTGGATTAAGIDGNAFSLDGGAGYIDLPGTATGVLNLTDNALTVEAWVNLTNYTQSNPENLQIVFDKFSAGPNTGYRLGLVDGRVELRLATATNPDFVVTSSDQIPLTTWTHIAGTYDGSRARIFVDGVEIVSVSHSGNLLPNTLDARIGNDNDGATNYGFFGKIDELAIYGSALSRVEIQAIHEMGGIGKQGAVIEGNWIGLASSGSSAAGNAADGIHVNQSSGNRIGGDTVSKRNVISGSQNSGIRLRVAHANLIAGNFIGTDSVGQAEIGNTGPGIFVSEGSRRNQIGGSPALRNVISGQATNNGIFVGGAGVENWIAANYLGLNAVGSAAISNQSGISINSTSKTIIGTDSDGVDDGSEGNIISGNVLYGIVQNGASEHTVIAGNLIGTGPNGLTRIGSQNRGILLSGSSKNNLIGTDGDGQSDLFERNVIAGSAVNEVTIQQVDSTGNRVSGNYIGIGIDGTTLVQNADRGVSIISGASDNIVGTNGDGQGDAIEGNVIAGVSQLGVRINASNNNIVAGNLIGTDATGGLPRPNSQGIAVESGTGNRIGTNSDGISDALERNVISGNNVFGISIRSGTSIVAGNLIGLAIDGKTPLGNAVGVSITGGTAHQIGTNGDGTRDAVERNVISGNRGDGINIQAASDVVIAGNYVGTDSSGTLARGNAGNGITVSGNAGSTSIGGLSVGNVISSNTLSGIEIGDLASGATATIQGNWIGTGKSGNLVLGNSEAGVLVSTAVAGGSVIVGDVTPGLGNVIRNNDVGVSVTGENAVALIRGNSISNNPSTGAVGLGIELGPRDDQPLSNDGSDSDSGPNSLQNYPTLSSALAGSQTQVTGSISGEPNASLTIDFYANPNIDYQVDVDATTSIAYGEGKRYLGSTMVATDANGIAGFSVSGLTYTFKDEYVTATATGPSGTSEFSVVVRATTEVPPTIDPDSLITYIVTENSQEASFGEPTRIVDEGQALYLTGDLLNVTGAPSIRIEWGDGTITTTNQLEAIDSSSFTARIVYTDDDPSQTDSDVYPILVTVFDTVGSGSSLLNVIVNNVAPVMQSLALDQELIREGDMVTLSGLFTDPGLGDTHTLEINWGDGTPTQALSITAGERAFDVTHTYREDTAGSVASINVTLRDDDGGVAVASTELTVENVAPIATINVPSNVIEGTLASISATTFDPGDDSITYEWQVRQGGFDILVSTDPVLLFTPPNEGQYEISLTVTDDENDFTTSSALLRIVNDRPVLLPSDVQVSSGDVPLSEGVEITLGGVFEDLGIEDRHTVTVDFGDGTVTGPIPLVFGSTSFSGVRHTYQDDPAGPDDTYFITVSIDDGTDVVSVVKSLVVPNYAPSVSLRHRDANATEVTIGAVIQDLGSNDRQNFVWEVGGVQVESGSLDPGESVPDITFPNPNGSVIIKFTSTDDDGGQGQTTVQYFVLSDLYDDVTVGAPDGSAISVSIETRETPTSDPIRSSTEVVSDVDQLIIAAQDGDDRITVYSTIPIQVYGGGGDDSVTTADGNDTVIGGPGADTISTGAGDDVLVSDEGDDVLDGGIGNDTYAFIFFSDKTLVDDGGVDTLNFEQVSKGTGDVDGITIDLSIDDGTRQQVYSSGTMALTGSFENVIGTSYEDSLKGNDQENYLFGGPGDDSITGSGGHDTLEGGDGSDTIDGTSGTGTLSDGDSIFGGPGDDSITAGGGYDSVDGGDGNDSIISISGEDTIFGGPGDDSISGSSGKETIDGGAGADIIISGGAGDSIFGGPGDDSITGGGGANIDGGDGNDSIVAGNGGTETVSGGDGNDTITGGVGSRDSIFGGPGDDSIVGGGHDDQNPDLNSPDTIDGGGGNDVIIGSNSNDSIFGGPGDDSILSGGSANDIDTIDGGLGNDSIVSSGGDSVFGGPGDDSITGGGGLNEVLDGGSGNDTIRGGSGNRDSIFGGPGDDSITGGSSDSTSGVIDGGSGHDTITGGGDNDSIIGGIGNDVIDGGGGSGDTIFGGPGDDSIAGSGNDTIDAGDGNDTIRGATGLHDSIFGGPGDDSIVGGNSDPNITIAGHDTIDGGEGNDTIRGSYSGDSIFGGPGDDSIVSGSGVDSISDEKDRIDGGDGNDTILGGSAGDSIFGGPGDDSIMGGGAISDIDTIDGGAGNDTIQGTINQQDSIFGGPGDDSIVGGADDPNTTADQSDTISGGDGNDTIRGGYGGDSIFGGPGDDSITGSSGPPTATNDQTDTIDGGDGDDTIQGGYGGDSIFGGPGDDSILGGSNDPTNTNDGSDTIDGGDGHDTIIGGVGLSDSIFGGPGDDSIIGGNNDPTVTIDQSDTLVGGDGADTIRGGVSNDSIFGGPGDDSLSGGGGRDSIAGGSGNDSIVGSGSDGESIDGGPGQDTLSGGGGSNDSIFGGDGEDLIIVEPGFAKIYGDSALENDPATRDMALIETDANVSVTTDPVSEVTTVRVSENVIAEMLGIFQMAIIGGPSNNLFDTTAYSGSVMLSGGVGDDTLMSGSGNDSLEGGLGDDSLSGGAGDDTYIFVGDEDLGSDIIDEASDVASDTLDFFGLDRGVEIRLDETETQTVSSGLVELQFTTANSIEAVIGTTFPDKIIGNDRNNILIGGGGVDMLVGGAGDDYISASRTRTIYLDFDSRTSEGDHLYTTEEREKIQGRIAQDFAAFDVQILRERPAASDYVAVYFNSPPIINGRAVSGGISDRIGWRDVARGGSVEVDVNGFLGVQGNQLPPTTENFVALSSTIASHEIGHMFGLRHHDAFGSPGEGVYSALGGTAFLPYFEGDGAAPETSNHLIASPASVRTTLTDALGNPYFGEREALKLAFAETGVSILEQDNEFKSDSITVTDKTYRAQSLGALPPLFVPNTIENPQAANYGKPLDAAAINVIGSIEIDGETSENDFYSFVAAANQQVTVEVLSLSLRTRIDFTIDSLVRIYDSSGNKLDYYGSPLGAFNDDGFEPTDSILLDVHIPADGTYYIEVDTFNFFIDEFASYVPGFNVAAFCDAREADIRCNDTDTGDYEVLIYRFGADHATVFGDTIAGGSGADTLVASSGNDYFFTDALDQIAGPAGEVTKVINNAPTIESIAPRQIAPGDSLNLTVSASDPDVRDSLEYRLLPDQTSPFPTGASIDSSGNFSWTSSQIGNYAAWVKATDLSGESSSTLLMITVGNTSTPVATSDIYTTSEDSARTGNVILDDTGNGADTVFDGTSANLIEGPTHGQLTLNPDGSFFYTPNADFFGTDTFTYDLRNGAAASDPATVTINVTPVDDAADDTGTTNEDATISGDLSDNDTYAGAVAYSLNTGPANGTALVNPDGTFTYTPAPDFNGTDSFTYNATDVNSQTETQTVTINVRNLVDVSGRIFNDRDNDGVFDVDEEGVGGVTVDIYLEGDDVATTSPIASADSAPDGTYRVNANLTPGSYKVVKSIDDLSAQDFLDGKAGNEIRLVVNEPSNAVDPDAVDYLFGVIQPSELFGMAWRDFDNDGEIDFAEDPIAGVAVSLSGTDDRGNPVEMTSQTDATGSYAFINLRPGDYVITETQPAGFADGKEGSNFAVSNPYASDPNVIHSGANTANDTFSGIRLAPGSKGDFYNFGELVTVIGETTTAGIGFWHNKNGQALIRSLNEGTDRTGLGQWLAATFPDMYGTGAVYSAPGGEIRQMNTAEMTNDDVADLFQFLFQRNKKNAVAGGPPKVDAQVMALALATYVTSTDLAGGDYAAFYGFQTSAQGIAYQSFNVLEVLSIQEAEDLGLTASMDSQGNVSIINILSATNSKALLGLLYDSNEAEGAEMGKIDMMELALRVLANRLYTFINEGHSI